MLSAATDALFKSYLELEARAVRRLAMPALERFIAALLSEPEAVWTQWAREFARAASDAADPAPVRAPLVQKVLLPALSPGVAAGLPGCARWLAFFAQHLGRLRFAGLAPELHGEVPLLLEALRVDPQDRLARERLVARRGEYLAYTLHELPAGVLYGNDGATLDQCAELLEELRGFEAHVDWLGVREGHAALIARCSLHYRRYSEYLAAHRPGGSYEGFLRARREWPPAGGD